MSRSVALWDALFWLAIAALVLLKLALVSDLPVQITFAPADDSLYVERAFHLLAGEAFGPYDSTILVKYPGISLWLAGARALGIPFLLSVNATFFAAGIYLATALRRCGASRKVVLVSFALYAFCHVTLGFEWIRVIREPLSTGLLVAMVAAMMHILAARRDGRFPFGHLSVLSVLFAFSLFLREEDRLLWGFLGLFCAALIWQLVSLRVRAWRGIAFVALALVIPAALGKGYEHALREYVAEHYGLPILHEFGEGEYPRMLAAIRSIRTTKVNRLVIVSQEVIEKLKLEVPSFRPVAERLPMPGPRTYSCQLHGVCSEWSNGWMPFWVKHQAFELGLTPTLPAAQDYFRKVRIEIEQACARGRLQCNDNGQGLVAPMELRWTRAYVAEAWRLAKMILLPDIAGIPEVPVIYDVPLELGRIYQEVTMTHHYDTQLQAGFGAPAARPRYVNPLADLRAELVALERLGGLVLLLAAFATLMVRLWVVDSALPGPLALATIVFGLYTLLRMAALSYAAVYLGAFSPRMMFSTYALATFLALPFLEETLRSLRGGARPETVPV